MRARGPGHVRIRSPPAKIRDHRSEWRLDRCPQRRRRDTRDERLRSLSPLELERSQRGLGHDRRSTSVERRDYARHLDGGRDCRVVRSRSPPYGQSGNRSQFNEDCPSDGFRQKYLLPDPVFSNAETRPSLKFVDDSGGPGISRIGREKDFHFSFSSALEENGLVIPKSLNMEDGMYRTSFTLPPDVAPVKAVGDIGHREVEDFRYGVHPHPDKIASRESYKKEKPLLYSRDAPYIIPLPHPKAFGSTSSGPSKDDFLGFYGGGRPPSSHGFARRGENVRDAYNHDDYSQAPLLFFGKDTKLRLKDMASYQSSLLSPSRYEAQEYNYPKIGRRGKIELEYLSDNFCRNMCPGGRMDSDNNNSARPSLSDPIVERLEAAVGSHKTMAEDALWNHMSSKGELASNYYDMNRTSWATKQDRKILGSRSSHLEYRSGMSRDHDNDISQSDRDYGFGRAAGPLSYRESLKSSTMSECNADTYELDVSPQRGLMAEELDIYDVSERVINRNHIVEEMNRYNCRYISSSNDNTTSQVQESTDSDEQWTGEHSTGLLWSKRLCTKRFQYGKTGRVFDRITHRRVSASDDWVPSQDLSIHARGCPIEPRIVGSGKVSVKKRLRLGPLNFHNPYPLNRRNTVYKSYKFRKKNQDDCHGDFNGQDVGPSEDQGVPAKPEPPEGSEKFNQKAYDAFLRFSKHLNENPVQQRRYMEQGNADSLLCIICGSQSKEFGDTRSLATHASTFQQQSRADHRGLLRAICVLMGWNSIVPSGGTWVRADLSHAEASSLKEDLILWPPLVIIHNSSIGNNNPDRRKVIAIEEMEVILKDMGFGGGKTKVCHGSPANQSIMVVKFGPTFSGLQDAERLHNYYYENKRGRQELQRINAHCSYENGNAETVQGDEMEPVLYGYLGIAEDLDKLDFETKKRSLVKSKNNIKAIADAPVKLE
ncbi:uncharacterized protein LOC122650539 [Telopea speciosissima]|uniref:uncharacterized protein LOC122650539 n=1 Tax=Telopea speciosissima TaxID=54955 RepID=UPI001CC3F256|nr:uncharacterized protein LOC122650539 [Telopea speciosissima]